MNVANSSDKIVIWRAICYYIQEKKNAKPHKCKTCDQSFTRLGHLKTHMLIHKGEKPFKCNYCSYACIEQVNLNRHVSKHTKAKTHSCTYCGQSFTRNSNLKTHITLHKAEKPYRCADWNKSFFQLETLTHHIQIHKEAYPDRHTQKTLKGHEENKHNICYDCDVLFESADQLKEHVLKHIVRKPVNCTDCSFIYNCKTQSDLQKEIQIHIVEKHSSLWNIFNSWKVCQYLVLFR